MSEHVASRNSDGWTIRTIASLTDEEAAAITFESEPEHVRLGEFVQVIDANGTRIGHISSAKYLRLTFDWPRVVCSIELM